MWQIFRGFIHYTKFQLSKKRRERERGREGERERGREGERERGREGERERGRELTFIISNH
jgi:hypothetical protein